MSYQTIHSAIDKRGVAVIELNRPDKRNAMSATMISELADVSHSLGGNADVRAVVLRAAGKVFCAGADLGWMMDQINADRAARMAEAKRLAMMLKTLNEMPKPLIAAVHGDAFGGGIGMMAVCDCVVAQAGCQFALTETRLGLIPATIGPYVIARLGEGAARRVFMAANKFGADEALRLDLVSRVAEPAGFEEALEAEIAPYLKVATGAVGRAKSLARWLGPRIDDEIIDGTIERLADSWESEEAKLGIQAFLDKRPPPWA